MYPVQMVASMPKLKKENNRSGHRGSDSRKSRSFDSLLENVFSENCAAECYMVTYTADSRLQTYSYHKKEYTF